MSGYGLLIGISFAIGLSYFQKHNRLVPKSKENWFAIGIIISSVIGARLYHVFDYWEYYSQHPAQIINTPAGGLGIYGGIIAAILFICLFAKINRLSLLPLLDTLAPILPLGQSIGRFGNFLNHEVYSPNGLPVWLFESIGCLFLYFVIRKAKTSPTALYLLGYGAVRFFLEFMRQDTWQIGNIKIAQLISLAFITLGLILLSHPKSKNKNTSGNRK